MRSVVSNVHIEMPFFERSKLAKVIANTGSAVRSDEPELRRAIQLVLRFYAPILPPNCVTNDRKVIYY